VMSVTLLVLTARFRPLLIDPTQNKSRVADCVFYQREQTIRGFSSRPRHDCDVAKCGRANGKELMARPRYQNGSLFIRGKRTKVWVARWREDLIREDGSLHRTQRTVVLGTVGDLSRREARSLLQKRVAEINQGRHRPRPVMTFETFAKEHWQAARYWR